DPGRAQPAVAALFPHPVASVRSPRGNRHVRTRHGAALRLSPLDHVPGSGPAHGSAGTALCRHVDLQLRAHAGAGRPRGTGLALALHRGHGLDRLYHGGELPHDDPRGICPRPRRGMSAIRPERITALTEQPAPAAHFPTGVTATLPERLAIVLRQRGLRTGPVLLLSDDPPTATGPHAADLTVVSGRISEAP